MEAAKGKQILYIGDDTKYWSSVEFRIKQNYEQQNWLFERVADPLNEEAEGQKLYCELAVKKPAIIYLDFTKMTPGKVFFSELKCRDQYTTTVLVGLVSDKEQAQEVHKLGLEFVFVKSAELGDVIYGPLYLALPGVAKKTKFALGKITKRCQLIDECRVGYFTPLLAHVESNFSFKQDDEIALESGIPEQNVPSKWVTVKKKEESSLYYRKSFAYDLAFKFVEPPDFDDGSDAPKEERIADYQERMKVTRKRHKEWVVTSIDDRFEKKIKIMTIDRSLRVLTEAGDKPIDSFPYAFRNYQRLDNELEEIERVRPSIIVHQMMSHFGPEEEEAFKMAIKMKDDENHGKGTPLEKDAIEIYNSLGDLEKEEVINLKNLVVKIKSIDKYQPYIILFRCYFQTGEKLKQTFQYPQLLAHEGNINLNIISKIAESYEARMDQMKDQLLQKKVQALRQKDPVKHRALNAGDLVEKRYYLKKKNELSFANLKIDINIVSLSESEITFSSEQKLRFASYEIDYPFPLYIRLIPYDTKTDYKEENGLYIYRSIIHAINEKDKKLIRRLVNEVFFEDINEARAQEDAAYWEKHNQALEDKMKAIEAELSAEEEADESEEE